ncbi:hypothetical protein Bbelb_161650 [Branchiostoma belcheri]|nr:hypothetical protein Bbelb_161650 [Branchiostoma belcheri]
MVVLTFMFSQGYEGGTALLPLSSFPQFDAGKDLYLDIVRESGDTRVLEWTARTLLWTAFVNSTQFKGRMSLIRGPGHPGLPHAVEIRNTRPDDSVTDGYFQFRQPGGTEGQEMGLRVFAITVTASPNPATIGQQVTLTCSVDGGRPDSFTWTHDGQVIPGTQNAHGNLIATFTVGPNSGGSYVCEVSDGSIGQGQKSIMLQTDSTMTTTTATPFSTPRITTAFASTTAPPVSSSAVEAFSSGMFSKPKTTVTSASQTLGVKPVQQTNLPRDGQGFGTAGIIACVFGVLILVLIAMFGGCFWKRRKKSNPTSEENAVNGNTGQQQQQPMILHHVNEFDAGTRAPIDPHQLSLPIQVSSLRSSYEEEQNTINSRRPLLPKKRPTLDTSNHPSQSGHLDEAEDVLLSTPTPANSLPVQSTHIDEVASLNNGAAAPQASEDNTDPKAASSTRPVERSIEQRSPTNARQTFSDASRSVSLDESTATVPHSLRSDQPNSRRCPSLEDMISYDTGSETTQNNIPTNPTKLSSNGQNKKPQHQPKKATSCRESTCTQPKSGSRTSLETRMEDTMEENSRDGQVSNQEGQRSRSRVSASDLRELSLSGNEVATTIDQMIRKVLVDEGHLDIPYHKFSELCLQLYNTQNNWKILADRLGLTNGDILLIDNCSTQHNLLAAEIVLRHWQRTSRRDRTNPCTVQNLRTILQDMGRADLVDLLQK